MKTKEELNTLREELNALNKKLAELNEEELAQVTGGVESTAEGEKSNQLVGFLPIFPGFP